MTEQPGYLPEQHVRTPVPDPTTLTDAAISRAAGQFRRELDIVRELLSERIDTQAERQAQALEAMRLLTDRIVADLSVSVDRRLEALGDIPGKTRADRDRDLHALREIIETRLDGLDRASVVQQADIDERVRLLRELVESRFSLHQERFGSVERQFEERDARTGLALASAKDLVNAHTVSSEMAAVKAETGFNKQIEAMDRRLDELKERIDRGEGVGTGAAGQRNETRLNLAGAVSLALLALSVVTFIILYVVKK